MKALYHLARPAIFALSPEDAHEATLKALEFGLHPRARADDARLRQTVWGLDFPNPLGIAAGYDKDARVADALISMGFGFSEVGTLTPLPQVGNEKPRIFRLVENSAIINRLGFNNGGYAAALPRLKARSQRRGIVGVNLGANKTSADRASDYVRGIETFNDVASYFTINISSPNTPGLRDLQAPAELSALLARLMEARARLAAAGKPERPIIVKIAPDVATEDLPAICEELLVRGVDGIAVSNTTLSRDGIRDAKAKEAGGLSGRPLFQRATSMLARVYLATGGKIPLIGIGGIDSGERALQKIEAGASLLQLYTGLVYEGPGLIGEIKTELVRAMEHAGVSNLNALRGRKADHWATKPI